MRKKALTQVYLNMIALWCPPSPKGRGTGCNAITNHPLSPWERENRKS